MGRNGVGGWIGGGKVAVLVTAHQELNFGGRGGERSSSNNSNRSLRKFKRLVSKRGGRARW